MVSFLIYILQLDWKPNCAMILLKLYGCCIIFYYFFLGKSLCTTSFKKSIFNLPMYIYITDLVCYTYFHWFFSPECQHIYTILVHCRSKWVICVWGLETREKARFRRTFSRVSRRIHIFTYMLRQCTCIVFILQF